MTPEEFQNLQPGDRIIAADEPECSFMPGTILTIIPRPGRLNPSYGHSNYILLTEEIAKRFRQETVNMVGQGNVDRWVRDGYTFIGTNSSSARFYDKIPALFSNRLDQIEEE